MEINEWLSIDDEYEEKIYEPKVSSSLPELTRIPIRESEYQMLNNKMDIFIENINCVLLKEELNEKEVFKNIQELNQKLNTLTQLIISQNNEIVRLNKNMSELESKLVQKSEREANKEIRSYYKTGTPVNFIPSKIPLSKLFKD